MHAGGLKFAVTALVLVALLAGCSKNESTSTTAASATPQSANTGFSTPTPVVFKFDDISVVTTGQTLLRLGFEIRNNSHDPVLCDPTLFSIVLSDGTTVPADRDADFKCEPDSIEVHQNGRATMFFNITAGYAGPITLQLVSNQGALVGRGRATVH